MLIALIEGGDDGGFQNSEDTPWGMVELMLKDAGRGACTYVVRCCTGYGLTHPLELLQNRKEKKLTACLTPGPRNLTYNLTYNLVRCVIVSSCGRTGPDPVLQAKLVKLQEKWLHHEDYTTITQQAIHLGTTAEKTPPINAPFLDFLPKRREVNLPRQARDNMGKR